MSLFIYIHIYIDREIGSGRDVGSKNERFTGTGCGNGSWGYTGSIGEWTNGDYQKSGEYTVALSPLSNSLSIFGSI